MKLYMRAAAHHRPYITSWKWIVWLSDNPPERHWRDGCMLPDSTAIHVGVYDSWSGAQDAGAMAYRFANVRWRTTTRGTHAHLEIVRDH